MSVKYSLKKSFFCGYVVVKKSEHRSWYLNIHCPGEMAEVILLLNKNRPIGNTTRYHVMPTLCGLKLLKVDKVDKWSVWKSSSLSLSDIEEVIKILNKEE